MGRPEFPARQRDEALADDLLVPGLGLLRGRRRIDERKPRADSDDVEVEVPPQVVRAGPVEVGVEEDLVVHVVGQQARVHARTRSTIDRSCGPKSLTK